MEPQDASQFEEFCSLVMLLHRFTLLFEGGYVSQTPYSNGETVCSRAQRLDEELDSNQQMPQALWRFRRRELEEIDLKY